MELNFFVTCGRGFDSFVVEEIKEKLSDAFNVTIFGEGKVSFQIAYCDIKELTKIYQLKLVERMFILLYYEKIEENYTHLTGNEERNDSLSSLPNVIETYKQKFQEVIDRKDWEFLTTTVKALKDHYSELNGIRKICNDPQICPASLDKMESRQKLLNIRLQKAKRKYINFECNESDKTIIQNDSLKESKNESEYDSIESKPDIYVTRDANTMKVESSFRGEDKNVNVNIVHDKVKRLKSNECIHALDLESECFEVTPNIISSDKKSENESVDVLELPQEQNVCELTKPHPLFRVSSRVSGLNKKRLPNGWVTKTFIQLLQDQLKWPIEWNNPLFDFYINLTDIHHIIGLSLVVSPLSCRSYIRHLTLRSTVCALMINFTQPPLNSVLLDPMCGSGIILLEAATTYKLGHVIGCDLSEAQLCVASCNLADVKTATTLIHASVSCLPLRSSSIDAVVCDFPFGKKHCIENPNLLADLLSQLHRVLVTGGRAVMLVSLQQEMQLKQLLQQQTQGLTFLSSHRISLGETSACICITTK